MIRFRVLCALLLAAAASPAFANPPAADKTPAADTTSAATPVFARYQKFNAEEPITDWRKANDTVREIGGWRVYLKEAMEANKAREAREAATKAEAKK